MIKECKRCRRVTRIEAKNLCMSCYKMSLYTKEELRERSRKYYAKNTKRCRELNRRYYQEHKEELKEYAREYYKKKRLRQEKR